MPAPYGPRFHHLDGTPHNIEWHSYAQIGAAVSKHQVANTVGIDAGNASAQIIDASGATEAIAAKLGAGRVIGMTNFDVSN